jgi:tight adherence protein C
MTLAILVGVVLFTAFLTLFLVVLPRSSAEGVLLEQVAREVRQREGTIAPPGVHSSLNVDYLARPFTMVRSLFSPEPNPDLVRRLSLAGYRKPSHADIYLGARLALPAVLGFSAAYIFESNVVIFFVMAILIGFFLPDLWLSRAINKRREEIKLSLPDGLDLLSICMEAGLGLDQGIVRVGQELRVSHRALSEELLLVNFEQRAGVQRIAAWQGFAERANVESVRSFVAMLIQTDRFGTPIAKSLSAFSDALRTQRRQQAEEMAAKTTIKLVPPLVFFIFPAMGVVTIGPALITVGKNLSHIVK